jgi:hypothetical protein
MLLGVFSATNSSEVKKSQALSEAPRKRTTYGAESKDPGDAWRPLRPMSGFPQRFAAGDFAPVDFAAAGTTALPGPPTGSNIGSLCSTGGKGGKGACGSVWYQ